MAFAPSSFNANLFFSLDARFAKDDISERDFCEAHRKSSMPRAFLENRERQLALFYLRKREREKTEKTKLKATATSTSTKNVSHFFSLTSFDDAFRRSSSLLRLNLHPFVLAPRRAQIAPHLPVRTDDPLDEMTVRTLDHEERAKEALK